MEQILQILSSKVTMVRSDNSVNRECLWLDLPMDHRKMLYNHCASGILIQPWLIYAFCSYLLDIPRRTCQECFAFLLKPSACYMHIPAEMRASCHQITLPTPILHLMSSTTWLKRSLGGKLPRRIYHVGLLLCRRWFSFNHHQLLQSGFFLCWSPCLGTSSMRALKIILRQPSCYVEKVASLEAKATYW